MGKMNDTIIPNEKDDSIHQEVVEGLNISALNTDGIVVSVIDSTVYLRGSIDSFDDFIKIEEFVGQVNGVKDLKNELRVKG